MKQLVMIPLCLFPVVLSAQPENVDSVRTDTLREVVVEAELQHVTAKVVTYTPTKRVKKSAQDAVDLLQQMSIPQVTIEPISKTMTTTTGQEIGVFINYLRASSEDMRGLKTTDVLKVEYFDFPSDPRFQGVAHAINIIVQEYEYGGYTKITDSQFALSGFINKGLLYSKFAYGRMVYDLYSGWDYVNSSHVGDSEYSIFKLQSGEITRNQEWLSSNFKYINVPISFRASYINKRIQIINTIGLSINNRFDDYQQGQLYFEPSNGITYKYEKESPYINRNLSWRGNYFFSLQNLWSIAFYPRFTYGHNNSHSSYITDLPQAASIINDAKENIYNVGANAHIMKRINERNVVTLELSGASSMYDVSYIGSFPYNIDFSKSSLGVSVAYTLNLPKVAIDANAGVSSELFNTNGDEYDDPSPFGHISVSWAPNKHNRFNMWVQYASTSTNASERSPNVIQVNELLYKTGESLLQNSRQLTINSSYTFMPKKTFMMQAFVNYLGNYDRVVTIYDLYNDECSIISTYRNSGDYTKLQVGINATLKLLDNSLLFQIRPSLNHFSSTGYIESYHTPFICSLYGQYYWRDFRFSGYYATRNYAMNPKTSGYSTSRSNYQIQIGWANELWNVALSANNFFRYSYDGSWGELNTPIYTKKIISYNSNQHAYIMFSAIYTFSYGKKINRKNEINAIEESETAILK